LELQTDTKLGGASGPVGSNSDRRLRTDRSWRQRGRPLIVIDGSMMTYANVVAVARAVLSKRAEL
jgi:hypothetical protein